jgi:hypothetical protein
MQTSKPIELKGHAIAGGKSPLICTPLVGRTLDRLLSELDVLLPKKPDVLEWRVDFFDAIGDTTAVIAAALAIKSRAGQYSAVVYAPLNPRRWRKNCSSTKDRFYRCTKPCAKTGSLT